MCFGYSNKRSRSESNIRATDLHRPCLAGSARALRSPRGGLLAAAETECWALKHKNREVIYENINMFIILGNSNNSIMFSK
jgi:hypothetical protein